MFKLTPADGAIGGHINAVRDMAARSGAEGELIGAIGGHINAVRDCYDDFHDLACAVAERCGVACPQLGPSA